jgi:Phosphoribosyl transferase domain
MATLSGVILSVEDTILSKENFDHDIFLEVTKLVKFLRLKNIDFVVFTNRKFTVTTGGKEVPLKDYLTQYWGKFHYICTSDDPSIPKKPKAESTQYVLTRMGWEPNSVIYVGASDNDTFTAVNGKLLFLRATWYANKTDYGFEFDKPSDVAKYIDIFCLREHLWCFALKDDEFEFYALAPFSTMLSQYTLYSSDAKATAKHGLGHPDFWVGALVSSLYFSGLHSRIDYITTYPGHKQGVSSNVMILPMNIFGKCFRTPAIPDLLIRHKSAVKSQKARVQGGSVDISNQLNTIHLNKTPHKSEDSVYARSPLKQGKTVLLIDDICTQGHSLVAGKEFIQQTGASVICVSWLKTINTDIQTVKPFKEKSFDPFKPQQFSGLSMGKKYEYRTHMTDNLAPAELKRIFEQYDSWDWPKDL